MNTNIILAEQTVSISELKKSPSKFFIDQPVAVLKDNKTTGYILSAKLFEEMVALIEAKNAETTSRFRPTRERMDAITSRGEELLLSSSKEDLNDFSE